MALKHKIQKMIGNWGIAFMRFPICMVYAFVFCVHLSMCVENHTMYDQSISFGLGVGFLSALVLSLHTEDKSYIAMLKLLLPYLSIPMGLVAYGWLRKWDFMDHHLISYSATFAPVIIISVVAVLHLCISLVPFIFQKNNSLYLRYNVHLLENFIESAALMLIAYLLLVLAITAITQLFDFNLEQWHYYSHCGIWLAFFFQSIHFLSQYPKLPITNDTVHSYDTRFFKTLNDFVALPVITLYWGIIIAYMIKLLLGGQHKEWIIIMSGWYVVLGFIVYHINKVYLLKNTSKLAIKFDNYFLVASIPIVLFYVYNCVKEISGYGITINLYYSAMLSVAAIAYTIYNMVVTVPDQRWLAIGIVVGGLIGVIGGPFSSKNVFLKNQEKRFIQGLEANGIIKDKKVVAQKITPPIKDSTKLFRAYYELSRYDALGILHKYDKENLLDSSNYAMLMSKLHQADVTFTPKALESKSFPNYPYLQFTKDTKLYPIYEQQIHKGSMGDGLYISPGGKLIFYQSGVAKDSLRLGIVQDNSSALTATSIVNQNKYLVYYKNISYYQVQGEMRFTWIDGFAITN